MKKALYISGLGSEHVNLSVKEYAIKMMKAIDENNPEVSNVYHVETKEIEYDKNGTTAEVATIVESQGTHSKEIFQFYGFSYSELLTAQFSKSNVIYKFVLVFGVLISRLYSFSKSMLCMKNEVNIRNKIQVIYFSLLYLLLGGYLILLIPSIGTAIASTEMPVWINSIYTYLNITPEGMERFSQLMLALFSSVMLFLPSTKDGLSKMAIEYLAANQYLSVGDQRQLVIGKLSRLIEVICENAEGDEQHLEIHAYSFGSIIAIDLLFPYEGLASRRIQECVKRLVTIGCPLDFVNIYWEHYLSNRNYKDLSLKSWYNIFSHVDVLSSELGDKAIKQNSLIESEEFWGSLELEDVPYDTINQKVLGFWQALFLLGIRAHQMYWHKDSDSRSCLFNLVQAIEDYDNTTN